MEQGSVLRLMDVSDLYLANWVSIPLEQGSVLRLKYRLNFGYYETVSIPLEQGSVLRRNLPEGESIDLFRLNPFGTGQCLTT